MQNIYNIKLYIQNIYNIKICLLSSKKIMTGPTFKPEIVKKIPI